MRFSTQLCAVMGIASTAFACDEHSSSTSGQPAATPVATTTTSPPNPSKPTTALVASIWQPAVAAKWQIILSKKVTVSSVGDASIIGLDLVENTNNGASRATIDSLHAAGKKVICYFSAGTSENWRPDFNKFPAADMGDSLDEWPGERWINTKSQAVRAIMSARIKMAADMGCDAIDPDNMDAYNNKGGGLGLKQADAVDYVSFLSGQAAAYGLATGLKNAGEIIPAVLGMVQFSVNEQCSEYKECRTYTPFITAGKPVFHIEYPNEPEAKLTPALMCVKDGSGADLTKFSTVQKNMELDEWVKYC